MFSPSNMSLKRTVYIMHENVTALSAQINKSKPFENIISHIMETDFFNQLLYILYSDL